MTGGPTPRPGRPGLLPREGHPEPGPRVWTVSDLNAAVRGILEGAFSPLWVAGEVANYTAARSGHRYFTLRDEVAQLRCVMWRSQAALLPADPEEGMEVRAFGRPGLYEARGEFQLVVSRLEAEGEGLWKLAFERLRARLADEGLLDPARKRPLPRHPVRVGIVTSPSGAALRDIVSVVRRRAPWVELVVSGCRVQGEGAATEIAYALELFAATRPVDVVIVGRGGGSIEDLWAFNEEAVARAIASCPVPVISAVGHETDLTIADLVADHRAPTPSAAAAAAVPDLSALRSELGALSRRVGARVRERVGEGARTLRFLAAGVRSGTEARLASARERLRAEAGRLEALSPVRTLGRGYAVPLEGGRILRHRAEFVPGHPFDLRIVDGIVPCRVREEDTG